MNTLKEKDYYIMSPGIALRAWRLTPYAYYIRGQRHAHSLTADEFFMLLKCNGQEVLEDSTLLQSLVANGLCAPCKQGTSLEDWQKLMLYDNHYMPVLVWEITRKCNLNCLHCFNAVDNSYSFDTFTWEECVKLMDEAKECGVNAFTITGGEPMLHPHFMDILRGIHARGMMVDEINTNLSLVTQEMLDEMKSFGCVPKMKTSFDAIGHHDWLRDKKGQEEFTLNAIRLCIQNDFPVLVHTNVHKLNKDAILPTAELLDSMGVQTMKLLRTTESFRWQLNSESLCEGGACIPFESFYDIMLEFSRAYVAKPHKMNVNIWQFLHIYPVVKRYLSHAVSFSEGSYHESRPVCDAWRKLACITAIGEITPCLKMYNFHVAAGVKYGNVKELGLKSLLTESAYLDKICTTVKQLAEQNEQCRSCRWWKLCGGGCRTFALGLTQDPMGKDKSKCLYFHNGYLEKTDAVFVGSGYLPA